MISKKGVKKMLSQPNGWMTSSMTGLMLNPVALNTPRQPQHKPTIGMNVAVGCFYLSKAKEDFLRFIYIMDSHTGFII